MNSPNKKEWEFFLDEGRRYAEIINRAFTKGNKFTPEILYNMACMSIEKLFMACFLKSNKMPINHTLLDLVTSMKEINHVPPELEKMMIEMNNFQEICSVENYERKVPSIDDVRSFIETVKITENYINGLLNQDNRSSSI